jgi:hypothetical protein
MTTETQQPAVGAQVDLPVKPQCRLTPWYPPRVEPVRDGVYMTSHCHHLFAERSQAWHAMRWDSRARAWFSADSVGREETDLIGWDHDNRRNFWWRGLAA